MNLDAIREGIKTRLDTIPGLQASARFMANPTPPAAHVVPGEINYHQAMQNGHSDVTLLVQAFVATVSDVGSQMLLDRFIAEDGDYSVKTAIEADPTLGGVADDLIVLSCSGYRVYPRPQGEPLLGAEFTVRVLA